MSSAMTLITGIPSVKVSIKLFVSCFLFLVKSPNYIHLTVSRQRVVNLQF